MFGAEERQIILDYCRTQKGKRDCPVRAKAAGEVCRTTKELRRISKQEARRIIGDPYETGDMTEEKAVLILLNAVWARRDSIRLGSECTRTCRRFLLNKNREEREK